MDLYNRSGDSRERISDGNAGMCVSCRINQDAVCPVDMVPDDGDEFAFVVRLKDFENNRVR